jgi:hypothetical protein
MGGYVVTAGYVTVETAVPGGRAEVDVPRGAALPDDVPAEQRDLLLRRHAIAPALAGPVSAPPAVDDAPPPGSPPPRRGSRSGTTAWLAYAHTHSVAVPDGYGRDQIIELLHSMGIPT